MLKEQNHWNVNLYQVVGVIVMGNIVWRKDYERTIGKDQRRGS